MTCPPITDPQARPEYEVLLHSLSQAQAGDTRLGTALSRVADWESLQRLASKHCVFPSLYRRLADTCPEAIPPEVLAGWRQLYLVHARRNLRLTGELLQGPALFESQGISAIPFKGPILAQEANGDPILRQFADLDILVSRKDIGKVKNLLLSQGYRPRYPLSPKQERLHLKYANEFTFEHPRKVLLDVHWRFAAEYLGGGLDPEEALARRVPVQILGKTVNTLNPEDNLLLLCQHGSFHSWATLSSVSDVAHLIHSQNNWDWPRLLQRAKDSGLRRQTLLGLSLARELLGAPVPPEVMEEADRDPSVVSVCRWVAQNLRLRNGEEWGFLEQTSFYLQTRDSIKDRFRYVWCHLAIPTVEDWRWVSLPDSLYGLYFVIRPLRLAFQGLIMPAWRCLKKLTFRFWS
ncbi:MAG: nucleotidyltransferase family protein [Desulfobaccales bacterium]